MSIRFLAVLSVWLAGAVCAFAQFGSFGDVPVEITADGNTRFEGGIAIAEDNVQIHYGEYSIYCDYAEYNPDTRDVLLVGNIRLYTPKELLTGQRALFNLETKQMRALEFSGSHYPGFFHAFSLQAPSSREIHVSDAEFTTDDSSQPDFHVKSKSVRIYTDSRVVFTNSTVYLGQTPIFWFPYLFANIDNTGFGFLPGYDSRWGAYLLTSYSFPIGKGTALVAKVHADYRAKFGPALGADLTFHYGKDDRSFGEFLSYYVFDTKEVSTVSAPGEPVETRTQQRYRVTFKQRLFLTDDIYATADINLLSDVDLLEDIYPNEFRLDPQPDNYLSVTKWDEFYTLNLIGRFQVNDFQDTTERLPELALDIKQHRLFGLPVYYDGRTSIGQYRRTFSNDPSFNETNYPDYDSGRFDTFHQLTFPTQAFGWLNIIPRVGIRGTAYTKSGSFINNSGLQTIDPITGQVLTVNNGQTANPLNAPTTELNSGGAIFRGAANFGVEVSAKISKAYEKIQMRWLGLDGVRHVIQPYGDYSYVQAFGPSTSQVLQFDRVVPTTNLLPLQFPQFTAIDSIDTWDIVRLGVRNRIETRRNQDTYQWFTLDSFVDVNIDNPYSSQSVSNVFNNFRFRPVNWFSLDVDSQLPVVSNGFSEVNAHVSFMPTKDLLFRVGDQYIANNEFFTDNNQVDFYAYWRVNDNWGLSVYEQYELYSHTLQYQRYMVHRDLSAWTASVGAQVRDSQGQGNPDLGVLIVLSLKDAPQVTLPIAFDQGSSPLQPGSSN